MKKQLINKIISIPTFLGIGLIILFYVISVHNYLMFHTLAELFSISVAVGLFMLAWNSRKFNENSYFLFLGIAYLFIGSLDLVHTISYKGMNIFIGYGANLPTQQWIAARYMESITLLIAPFVIHRKLRHKLVFFIYAIIFSMALITPLIGIFPDCYIQGAGLTPFKIISEYIICFILIAALYVLYQKREHFDGYILRLMVASIGLTIFSELAFTFYVSVYGHTNFIGHILKILSFYLIYKAIIETGLKRPYSLLFKELQSSRRNLAKRESDWRAILNNSLQAFVLIEPDYTIRAFNELAKTNAKAVFGIELKMGDSILKFVLEEDRKDFEQDFETAINGETVRTDRKMPGDYWFSFAYIPVVADNGEVLGVCFSSLDITERKRSEEALKSAHAQLQQIIDNSSSLIIAKSLDGRYILANHVSEELISYQKNEMLGKTDHDIFPKDIADKLAQDDQKVIISREPLSYEEQILIKDQWHIFLTTKFPLFDIHGGIYAVAAMSVDITDLKKAEDALRNSKKLFETAINASPNCIFIKDIKGEYLLVNKAIAKLYGTSQEEMLGKTDVEFAMENHLKKEEAEKFFVNDRQVIEEQKEKFIYEESFSLPDGSMRWFQTIKIPISLPENTKCMLGIAVDITERKQIEEALKQSEKRFKSIIERSPIGIGLVDSTGKLFECNEALAEMIGYSCKELLELNFEKFTHPDDLEEEWQLIKKMWEGETNQYQMEKRYIHRNSSIIWVNVIASVIRDEKDDVTFGFAFVQDITQQKKAKEALKQSEERYRKAQKLGKVGNWEYNIHTGEFWGSHEAKRIYGFDPETTHFTREEVETCIPDRENVHQALADLIEKDKEYNLEFDILTHDTQERKSIISIAQLERDEDGNPLKVTGVIQDITERKKIQERNTFLSAVVKNSDNIVVVKDLDLRVIATNQAFANAAGHETVEDMIGKTDAEIFNVSEDTEPIRSYMADEKHAQTLSPGEYILREEPVISPNGEKRFVLTKKYPIFDEKDNLIATGNISVDITERRKAEQALKESEKKYRTLVETSNDLIFSADMQGNFLFTNSSFEDILGYTDEELKNINGFELVHPDDIERINSEFIKLSRGEKIIGLEYRYYHKDGFYVHLLTNGVPFFDDAGNVVGSFAISHDITERKQAEKEIREKKKQLQVIYDTVPILMCILNRHRTVISANKAFKDVTGWPNSPFHTDIACGVLGCVHALEHPRGCGYGEECNKCKVFAALNKTLTTGVPQYNVEFRTIIEKDGRQKEVYMLAFTEKFQSADDERVLLCLLDITNRKQAEESLQAMLAEKEILLKEIHHRVKNNLQTIQSLLYKQQQHISDQTTKDILSDSINRVKSMALIHEQLYRSKALANINLADYIREFARKLFHTYKASNKKVFLDVNAADVYLSIDKAIPVALILNELITNSLKYAFPKKRQGKIWIECTEKENQICVMVKDNGIGLPTDFDIERVETLGLYLVYNIATKQLGGSVEIERDEGTAFVVRF